MCIRDRFIVAFLFFVFGMMILKKNYFKPWKTIGHSLFFICWLTILMGAITKGEGVLSGVYGFQIMDFLNSVIGTVGLWTVSYTHLDVYKRQAIFAGEKGESCATHELSRNRNLEMRSRIPKNFRDLK